MKRREFTQEQVDFIRNGIAELPTRKLAEAYSMRFQEALSQTELRRVMIRNNIQNPRKEYSMLPIGTERYSAYYDCIVVKVDTTSVKGCDREEYAKRRSGNWQFKQNLIWESTTGKKIPWRHIVMFLDGDRTNYSPDNLYAVPLQVAGTIAKMNMFSENAVINKTALMWGQLYFALKK